MGARDSHSRIVAPLGVRLSIFGAAPFFLAGVVAFDLLRAKVPRRLPAWIWPLGVIAAILLYGPFDDLFFTDKLYRAWFISLGIAILYAYTREWHIGWVHHAAHAIAEHSYGIYLAHIVLLWFVVREVPRAWAAPVFCISLPLSVIVLYRYLERPTTLLGVHLSRRVLRSTTRPAQPNAATASVPAGSS